jgi:flagellar basal-body rod protein FlgG
MFNALPMLQNSISATSDAMNILSANAQAFQTDGYKQLKYSFASLFSAEMKSVGGRHTRNGASFNQNVPQGVTLIPMGLDMSQGGIRTGQALNSAIDGQGFFLLQEANKSQFLLTRASEFIFSADGTLIDVFGRKVKGYKMVNGKPDKSQLVDIKIDPNSSNLSNVGFESNGILTSNYQARKGAIDSGSNKENLPEGTAYFQLALGYVGNPSQMDQTQGNAFKTTLNSGSISYFGISGENNLGKVIGGSIESSNVNPAEVSITGIQLQRGYNATQAALTMTNRFLSQIIEVVSKA